MRKAMVAAVMAVAVAGVVWGQGAADKTEWVKENVAKVGAAEVPVKRVVLFSSGVGFFEHEGVAEGNLATPMRFETAQINDVLKSLVVYDRDGGIVRNVTYAANDPVNKTLKSFQVDLSGNPPLADIVNQIRGAQVGLVLGDETVEGTVLGVESKDRVVGKGDAEKTVTTWTVNVITAAGIRAVALEDVRKLDVKDEKIKTEMNKALATLAQARDQSKKVMTVNFEGVGKRRVGMGYLVETPVWKTSYRLMLPDATSKDMAKLQGWAIVENQTDNDWTDVELSLVGGRPLGFIELLYQPLYNPRPVMTSDIAVLVKPQMYGGGGGDADKDAVDLSGNVRPPSFNLSDITQGRTTKSESSSNNSLFSTGGSGDSSDTGWPGRTMKDYSQGVASVAQTNKIGEMFHYNVEKVTLPRQQSSMIPIITEMVEFDRVSIYNVDVLAGHPLYGVRLKNKSEKYLLGGPITVLDTVKEGTSYAGDARIEDIPPGQTRLLSYAVDQEMAAAVVKNNDELELIGAAVGKGMLKLSYRHREVKEYSLENKGAREKEVVVESPMIKDYVLKEPAKYSEKTETMYRFQVPVKAKSFGVLRVVQENVTLAEQGLLRMDVDTMQAYMKEGAISGKVKEVLRAVSDRRATIADMEVKYKRKQTERSRLLEEQGNIRENLRVLPKGSQSEADAVADLKAHDTDLKKVTKEMRELQDATEKAKAEYQKFVEEVVVE
ncbi:MAG: DUF4139 domain-containing protein [Phycisphaerales bacterium]|nr:DUF4139 domain-containing protein [Phycisphaerales bacterium]